LKGKVDKKAGRDVWLPFLCNSRDFLSTSPFEFCLK